MRYGSLFSGTGALDMGIQSVLGGETVWHSEIEHAPSKIHAHHWPDVPNLGDVTKVDWSAVEPVDVITGGSPCQDVSAAGKRAGMRAGTRSGLWASMCDAIETIRPGLVVWENVRGAHSAEADSDMEPCSLGMGHGSGVLLRATGRVVGDLLPTPRATDGTKGGPNQRGSSGDLMLPSAVTLLPTPTSMDSHASGGGYNGQTNVTLTDATVRKPQDWGIYAEAIHRWETVLGRLAPPPTTLGKKGNPQLNAAFSEFMMGLPARHVTDPAIGLTRNEQLKALGNGVVPQQVALATRLFLAAVASERAA